MNNEATHVKTQEDYSKFSSIVNEFLQEQMNEDFMEKNLLEAGVTSLQMMRISNALRKHGYKISFAKMISDPYVKHWWDNADINVKRKSVPPLETSNNSPKQFPLTDVQYAYWVGRKEGQVLGGNACHAYFEFDPDTVNLERLQEAWEELQARHPMLRAKFNNNGTQEIMEKPYSAKLQIYDFRKSDDFEHDLLAVREKLSHRKLDIANGQVAELGISLLPEDKLRMHFDIDLLVADMQSLQIIFRDLAAIYNSEYRPAIPENWDFGIYLENEKNNKINDYRKAEKYWKSEIESLPLGPALTLRTQPETIAAPKFSRRKYLLEHKKWEKLKSLAAQYCTTPAMVLLTLYAAVLDRWSTNQSFLINMPLFDRNTEIENIDNVIADFTNVLLFHADCKENCTFYEQLQKVQNQFRESVDNSEYSGVQVVRELSKLHPGEKCIAPVVFSCNYGTPFVDDKFEKTFGSLNYMVSQTPQVWIDFQIFEINNGLNLSWDAVDELFPDGMLDKMFAAFVAMLNELVSVKDWNKYVELLPDLAQERGIDNITEYYGNGQLLHSAFFVNAVKKKNQIAIIDENDGRNYTYEEVANKAKRVSSYLKEQGVAPGDLLAVSLSRGINQIISILGILAAGAGYIPINVNQPLSRRERIYSKSDIKFAITDTRLKKELEWPETVTVLDVMEADAYEPLNTIENYPDSNTAYVIFTSGSTGEPKGVEIAHFAAVNTIETINKQYRVSADDKIIAVSSYDFDLSVYDIFGILSAGGTLILIKDSNSRDAEVWLDIAERHSVTLWNSVPTLLNMLLIVAEGKGKEIPSLRLAMLSGDWIGMDIPERLNHVAKNSHLLSMGGATEASIWSNFFDVELPVPEEWSSIPYGKPLKNQYYRVVDSKGRDCPTWVPGELWIGGTGVAKGYIGDSEITDKSFVNWNENRWYKTGDLGRYWADGNIEFLGRKDFQVKIRGHRIELGEIEAAMNKYPGVKKSVAAAVGDVQGNKYLAGYIIPENGYPESLFDVNKVSDTDLMYKWDRLWADLKEGVAEVTAENNVQEYLTLANCLDEVSREYMYSLMRTLGIWVEPGTKYKLSALLMSAGIDLSYQELIQQWVNELVKIGRILAEEDYFVNCSSPKEMDRVAFIEKYPEWKHEIDDALKYLEQFKKYCHAIMTGNMDTPQLLAKEDYISPDAYMATLPGAIECKRTIKNILSFQKKEGTAGQTVRIMELGARNLGLTSELLDCMDGIEYEYVCTDASSYYLNQAKEKFKNNSRVHYENLDINSAPNTQGLAMHYFDVVLAVSTLHRCRDIKASLKHAGEYLRAGGLLILLETTENTILQHVSTGILEKGFSTVTDERKGTGKPLLTKDQWSDAVLKCGFAKVNTAPNDQLDLPIYNQGVIVALAQPETYAFNSTKLKAYLENMIPSYMIPTAFMEIDKFPLSANGKVDRKALPVPVGETRENAKDQFQEPETAVEKELAAIWKTVLHTETGNDLAYVIYTSGSTGMPKGVMIEHRAAVNTIIDVNERFAVGKDDKCIALSNLNFDLSVYDIFGLLIAGGTVVIPDAKQVKEPQHWLEIMQENKITVWNSVPAFMQMFMEFLSTKPDTKLPLRVVIMSGDWIPMELPEMIKMHSESVRMISMGGATEASIWSNYYEVESVKDGWTSIPYGKPLTNQKFYVLDQEMNDCPNWVAGRLFIAGEGLARGYWKDRKRTEERFINHPVTHERLYYTGDLGRYWPDGNIEFLGREDTQVKVRGHRIELGEAENVLLTHELIKSAVVVVEEDKSGLAAAVVLNEDSDCCDNKNVEKILHEYLGKKLPEYMVPGKILVMEQLPLSVNGKVDRKALRKILGGYQGQISEEKKKEAPQGELEVKIAAIWERVLGTKEISRDDDFFMCGGDSLKAVKIISELNATEGLPNDLAIQTLFALPTVALLAEQIEKLVSLLDVEENTEYEEGVL